jgi:hypothetical protein
VEGVKAFRGMRARVFGKDFCAPSLYAFGAYGAGGGHKAGKRVDGGVRLSILSMFRLDLPFQPFVSI